MSADARGAKAVDGPTGTHPIKATLAPALALTWCIVVVAAYYGFNYAYYREKITVFARFLVGLLS